MNSSSLDAFQTLWRTRADARSSARRFGLTSLQAAGSAGGSATGALASVSVR